MVEKVSGAQQYDEILQQVREHLKNPTEEGLNRAFLLLDDATHFSDGKNDEISSLRREVQKKLETLRARQLLEETRAACEALWSQEQGLLKAKVSPDKILQNIFEEALKLAEDAYNQYSSFFLLEGLKNDAQLQYNHARERYQIKTTANLIHNYQEQIQKLEEESDKEREIAWNDERGQFVGSIKVRNAIEELMQSAQIFAHNKAQQYMAMAENYVRDHQPRFAHEVLEKRKELYLLPSEDEKKLSEFDQLVIQPELTKLETAEELAHQALSHQDIRSGWNLLNQAIGTYTWAPGIVGARKVLLERALGEIKKYLDNAQKQYQDFCQQSHTKEALQEAVKLLREAGEKLQSAETAYQAINISFDGLQNESKKLALHVKDLSEQDSSHPLLNLIHDQKDKLDKKIIAFYDEQNKIDAQIKELRNAEDALAQKVKLASVYQESIETEYERLKILFDRSPEKGSGTLETFLQIYDSEPYRIVYGELNAHLPGLQALRTQILAFEDFEQVIQTLEDAFFSNDLVQIDQALKNIETLASQEKGNARGKRLNTLAKRMNGRLAFLQGMGAWQEGDYATAEVALERVKMLPGHPDSSEAQAILDGIKAQRNQEKQVREKLKEAQKLLEHQPQRAYEILLEILPKPSRFRDEIRQNLEDARSKWEDALLTRLDEASQSPSNVADKLREIANELLALPEPHSLTTIKKARQAKALAFASDARLHEKANRLKEALKAWDQARQIDTTHSDYEENWRRVRLFSAQRALNNEPGEGETRGILTELQNELPDEPQVLTLISEQYYRLSRLGVLNAEQQFDYLERAGREVKSALNRTDFSLAERGKLEDLRKKIENDSTMLRQQADLERELASEFSLARLEALLQILDNLRSGLTADMTMRIRFDQWWQQLCDGVVRRLENEDEELENELEKRFEVRSKVALLSPEHHLAHEVGPEIVRQAEKVLQDIGKVLGDFKGIQLDSSKNDSRQPLDLVYAQQSQLDRLRKQADMLYGLIERFSARAGGDVPRLKSGLLNKRSELTGWMEQFSKFLGQIHNLSYESDLACRSDDWSQFQNILTEITASGFGKHRAVQLLLQEKDEIQRKRNRLNQLRSELLSALKDPDGLKIFEAQEKLRQLLDEDEEDTFGFRDRLSFEIPFQKDITLNKVKEIQDWLNTHAKQIRDFGNWLYQAGAKNIWPNELEKVVTAPVVERMAWDATYSVLKEMQYKGQFKEELLFLDFIASGTLDSSSSSKHLETLIKKYKHHLPLEKAKQKLSQPPWNGAVLLPFLESLLIRVESVKQGIQKDLDALEDMREQTQQNKEEWNNAKAELEQSMEELRTVKQSPLKYLPFSGYDKQLENARQRCRRARGRCEVIAPGHPLLEIETLD